MNKALFGAGCFWGIEEFFKKVEGILETKVGYSGGHTKNPSYEEVCTGSTNHAEVVLINFDDKIISYNKLVELFWECHESTQINQQGYDIGTQYRSVIFYFSDEQKEIAKISKNKKQKFYSKAIATEITKAKEFFLAEEYHQCYIQKQIEE